MPEELSQELIARLSSLRSRREWQHIRTGLFRALGICVFIATIALAVEAVFHLPITGRTILFWTTAGLCASSVVMLFLPAVFEKVGIRPRLTNEDLAARIGRHFAEVEDKLVNVLQLNHAFAMQSAGSGAFAHAAFSTEYGSVRHLDFNAILDNRPVRRSMLFFIVALIVAGGTFIGTGSELLAAGDRLIHFETFYQKPAPFELIVEPGNTKLLRGAPVKFVVRTKGEQLNNLTLNLREEGAKEFDRIELRAVPVENSKQTQFIYELRAQRPMEYYAEARDIESEKFMLAVLDRPLVKSLTVTVAPPAYTREAARTLDENLGDITGIVGTRMQVAAQSSKELLAARLVFTPFAADSGAAQPKAETYNLNTNGALANGAIQLRRSGYYHIEFLDTDSLWSEKPIEYTVTLSDDEMPSVALLDPGERADLPGNLRLPMLARIHDDFGFSKLRLGYRITKSKFTPEEKEYKWLDVPLADYHAQDLEVPYIWNLAKLDITPEDELGYVFELADNDVVSGPKKARTMEFAVRFPSVDEIFQKAEEEHAQTERSLQEIKQDAEELKKKIDETVSEIRQQSNSDIGKKQQEFSVRKDAEDIMKRQAELENRVADVKNKLEQMTKNLDEQNAISEETMQKYAELQKLMEEVRTPELDAAFDKLKQAMKQMDQKALEQAMKEVQFNEDQFKKAIERTANLLKKIKLEQKLDELMKRSDELAKNQEQTAKEQKEAADGKQQESPQQKAAAEQKQKDAMNELARMQEEAKQMAKDMQKLPEQMQAPQEMQDAAEAVNDPTTEQAMEDAKQAMQQSQHSRASQRSQDASQKLKKARNKLEDLKRKMAESEKQRTLAEMKRMRDEMNRLSKEEEKLKQKSKEAMPNSNVFRDYAAEQSERREELGDLASDMMQLAQKSPNVTPEMGRELGKAFNQMTQAQQAMTERDQQQSMQGAQGAMASLNRASQETQNAMNQMQQQGGGSCPNPGGMNPGGKEGEPNQMGSGSAMQQFLNQINNFAEQQQALNQQMQQMMNGQGQGMQREMMQQQAAAARMQAGQQALQKSVEELAREQQQAGQGKKKAVDDLKKIAEEMQDLVSEMRTKGVRPETIQRQERILSRLLEAQRSVNERDKEETREATSGENMARMSPDALNLSPAERRNLLREEALRARDAGYTKDYQQLIRKYLEQLEK